jgi:lipoprotein-releasing system ATP-binding protein
MDPRDGKEKQVVLRASNIYKTFYTPAQVSILKGVNLTLFKGDTVAIMGRSGEGKSTLLQILGTLESPCSGELTIANENVTSFNKSKLRNKKLAFIFQSFHLLEDYTALENVLMPARIARQNVSANSSAYERGSALLSYVGLADRKNFHTKLLSGGEKQRVAIARALCNDPDIILADEPSGNLDRQTARQIHDLLLNFAKEQNKTLLVVTHDDELANLCNKRYILCNGLLV